MWGQFLITSLLLDNFTHHQSTSVGGKSLEIGSGGPPLTSHLCSRFAFFFFPRVLRVKNHWFWHWKFWAVVKKCEEFVFSQVFLYWKSRWIPSWKICFGCSICSTIFKPRVEFHFILHVITVLLFLDFWEALPVCLDFFLVFMTSKKTWELLIIDNFSIAK